MYRKEIGHLMSRGISDIVLRAKRGINFSLICLNLIKIKKNLHLQLPFSKKLFYDRKNRRDSKLPTPLVLLLFLMLVYV